MNVATLLALAPTATPCAKATPKINAGHNIGEWNSFRIAVRGDHATMVRNGKGVIENARITGLPAKGAIGLQHHGRVTPDGTYQEPPSLVQYRNIFIKEL